MSAIRRRLGAVGMSLLLVGGGSPAFGQAVVRPKPELTVQMGHLNLLYSVAFSPDGKYLATASADKTARLWNAATGEEIRVFKGTHHVLAIALSPDGKHLATGGYDAAAHLWDASTGEEIRVFTGHEGAVNSVAFSPDGKSLATASADKTARLWDLTTGKEIRALKGHAADVTSVAFSPDGKSLATASNDTTARLWDAASGEERRVFAGHAAIVYSVAFSPDGRRLSTGNGDNTVRLWDSATGKELRELKGHTNLVHSVAFSRDGKHLATASYDNTARLWDAATGKGVLVLKGHDSPVMSAAFSPDGKCLATASLDATARLWSTRTGREIRVFEGRSAMVWSVAFSPDGKSLATASNDHAARLWDMTTGGETRALKGHADEVRSVAFSPDGKSLATASEDKTARLWDAATGAAIRVFEGHADAVHSVAFSPDGKRLATASTDGTTRLWDIGSGKELCRLISQEKGWVVVSPDGYFDGSPEGMKSIRWTVGMQSFPLEAFSEGYYVPGLMARLLAGGPIVATKLPRLSEGFALPPTVKITSPRNGSSIEGDTAEVTVSAADQGGGVDELRLFHNGKAVGGGTRDIKVVSKGSSRTQTFPVTLVDGDNTFRAIALSRDRIESNPDEITVKFAGPQKQADLHLMVVGINQYKNPALELNYAQPDAQALLDFFAAAPQKLFKQIKKHVLLNEAATKPAILAALAQLRDTARQDVVLIYFAGHGDSLENVWYFIPYDLVYPEREEEVKRQGISSKELEAAIPSIGAQKVLVLIDACKSGGALLAFAGRGVEDRKALSQLARATGVHVMAASNKEQLASEVKELGHGVFTYTLLEGLGGKAAAGAKGGLVTVRGLLTYVENNLPDLSQKYKAQPQYPVVSSQGMDFPITTGR